MKSCGGSAGASLVCDGAATLGSLMVARTGLGSVFCVASLEVLHAAVDRLLNLNYLIYASF